MITQKHNQICSAIIYQRSTYLILLDMQIY